MRIGKYTGKYLAIMAATAWLSVQPAAAQTVYQAMLSGANENPSVITQATGMATITINGTSMQVSATFANLSSGLADSHVHCCAGPTANATVAIGFTGLPLGMTTGTITGIYDLTQASTFRAPFITASGGTVDLARARFLNGLSTGQTYFNIHSTTNPSGEIRGQLAAAVPEPATWGLMIIGFGATGVMIRRRRARRQAIAIA